MDDYDWDMLKEISSILGFIICVLILIIGLISIPIYFLEKKACHEFELKMNKKTDYSFWTDCMVKVDGEYISMDRYNNVRLTNE